MKNDEWRAALLLSPPPLEMGVVGADEVTRSHHGHLMRRNCCQIDMPIVRAGLPPSTTLYLFHSHG